MTKGKTPTDVRRSWNLLALLAMLVTMALAPQWLHAQNRAKVALDVYDYYDDKSHIDKRIQLSSFTWRQEKTDVNTPEHSTGGGKSFKAVLYRGFLKKFMPEIPEYSKVTIGYDAKSEAKRTSTSGSVEVDAWIQLGPREGGFCWYDRPKDASGNYIESVAKYGTKGNHYYTATFSSEWSFNNSSNASKLTVTDDKEVDLLSNGDKASSYSFSLYCSNNNYVEYYIKSGTSYIYYEPNGASGNEVVDTKDFTGSTTLKGVGTFSRDEYQLDSWNTKPDGSGKRYALGETYSARAGVKLYAQWKPYMRPKELTLTPDKWNGKFKLAWSSDNNSNYNTEGKWYIFRMAEGETSYTKITELAKNATSYSDTGLEVGLDYTYAVTFVPDLVGSYSQPTENALTTYKKALLPKTFVYSDIVKTNISDGKGGVHLSWVPEKSGVTTSVEKFNASSNNWEEIYSGTATSYTDEDVETFGEYTYRLKTIQWDKEFYSEQQTITYMIMSEVKNVKASQGYYSNMVKINWDADQRGTTDTRYVISRKLMTDSKSVYTSIYETMGQASSYYYEDASAQPGQYYFYKVTAFARNSKTGKWAEGNSIEVDGFNSSRGIVSGRVTFGSGTAVDNVVVRLTKNTDDDDPNAQFFALNSQDETGIMTWTPTETTLSNYLDGKPFSVQMWVNAENVAPASGERAILNIKDQLSLYIKGNAEDEQYEVCAKFPGTEKVATGIMVPAGIYSNITVAYNTNGEYTVYATNGTDSNGDMIIAQKTFNGSALKWQDGDDVRSMTIGADGNSDNVFHGNIDDIRVWKTTITEKEIRKNVNRMLAGTEANLLCYWPLDEGVNGIPYIYDCSKTNGVPNGNHAVLSKKALFSGETPAANQLSLYGLTDSEGNFTVRGVPFTGDGTSYSITPIKGIHEFNPAYVTRYVSNNSLTHNAVDFTDISSFPVQGVVMYENTTIPVDEAYVYVDGTLASKDGEAIMTNAEGEFRVDVPIGDHYIQIKKTSHEFVDNGRYPADPDNVGAKFTFTKEVSGLTFFDNTKVAVAGRVAGGDIENEKPLGFGNSKANIGQAKVVLDFTGSDRYYINAVRIVDGLTTRYEKNTENRSFETASELVNSTANVEGGKNVITIMTDPNTGEFAAMLPPLSYKASSITIPSQPEIDFSNKLPVIDASNAAITQKDSILVDEETEEYKYFTYIASARVEHKSTSNIDVTENVDGTFGEQEIEITPLSGKTEKVKIYDIDETGKVNYTFGYPIYSQLGRYTYNIFAYEEYLNKDNANDIKKDLVPLKNADVTIQNQYATSARVTGKGELKEVEDNTFQLDDNGKAKYQFQAGLPNIQEPYTRGISISYNNNGTIMQWEHNSDFQAIVLGMLPTGTNFVTKGPDKVMMILRDPPGTASNTTYAKGVSTATETHTVVSTTEEVGYDMTTSFGITLTTFAGVGGGTIQTITDNKWALDFGISEEYTNEKDWSTTHTVTSTEEFSTSDTPDFVGALGDVFIGASTNVTLGTSNDVVITKNEQSGEYELGIKQNMVSSQEFETNFTYTANYIENVLIPNLEDARDNLIQPVADVKAVNRPSGDKPIYVSALSKDDEKWGTCNDDECWGSNATSWNEDAAKQFNATGRWDGPSYSIIAPAGFKDNFQDEVAWYNNSIALWIHQLYENEKAKVEAIRNPTKYNKKNYSFDAGSSVTISEEKTNGTGYTRSDGFNINVSFGEGWSANTQHTGYEFHMEENVTSGGNWVSSDQTDTTTVMSYTLKEDGDDDYLSVDVYKAPDNFGPIFRTRGGATSAPFEDLVVTKYYEPGFELQARTMQIEKPELSIIDQTVTGVPSGKDAQVRITLRNNSETGEDCYYGLKINPESNPDGLQILLDGQPIMSGVNILVPAGQPLTKTLLVRQTNSDILEYKDISLNFFSTSQPDDTGTYPGIYSNGNFSIFFQPSVSDIKLEANTALVNTAAEEPLMLSMSGYDYNQASFQSIRLQYKGLNDANFVTLQEYVKDSEKVKADPNLKLFTALSGVDKLNFPIDLRDNAYTDQTYVFRALTVGVRGGDEVINSSEELKVVRDMNRPQLIANPSPSNGILESGSDITLTFNEDIRNSILTKLGNFTVTSEMNETAVSHNVALDITSDTPAKTQSTINLADKSFTAEMWLKYSTDGTIFQHGTSGNNFTVGTENGKLAISIGNEKVMSATTLPKDKWLFLAFNYDCSTDQPVVNASYALDADIVTLLQNKRIRNYEGNGPVAIGGKGMRGNVQELSLWNEAHTISDALSNRNRTKSPYTSGLIGYWQFDEGHGTIATDRSRSRHITLPSENAWYLNAGKNYVVQLDGNTALVAASGVSTKSDESYLIETWFRADPSAEKASVFSIKNKMDVALANDKDIEVSLGNTTTTVSLGSDMKDGQWHHLAFNVLRSTGGSATLYVDGKARRTFAASAMPNLSDGVFVLGARYWGEDSALKYEQFMKGEIDEFRVWKGRYTKEYIANNMFSRVKADEEGLAAYYPMETRGLDQFGQVTTSSTDKETAGNGLALITRQGNLGTEGSPIKYAADGPSLKTAPARENVQFDFVASERQITLQLLEEPAKIENCNIYFTVKDVKDANGNTSQPISWTILAQQNQLKWNESDIDMRMKNGEEKSFSVEIINSGVSPDNWVITNIPSWLTANAESGSLAPQQTKKITFSVEPGTPIGIYDATISLVGNQNIDANLNISLRVMGDAPDWNPTPSENAMVVVGQLHINNVVSSDPEDMVAAFNGLECVAVARPVYNARYDAYVLTMNVYGNTENAALTYKAYDASTGIIYPFIAASDKNVFTFNSCKVVGNFNNLVVFSPEDKIEQKISLGRNGWKWFSMYVNTEDDNAVPSIFTHTDAVTHVKGFTSATVFGANKWYGALTNLSMAETYKLCTDAPFEEVATGVPADPQNVDIHLNADGWSWIGYPLQNSCPVTEAFADADPQEGDVVMNQSSFAMYMNGNWSGSLNAMIPGEGYKYFSNSAAKTFHYQKPSTTAKARSIALETSKPRQTLILSTPENMAMTAVVKKNGMILTDDVEVTVLINNDISGYSGASDADGLHYITVGGTEKKARMNAIVNTADGEYAVNGIETYAPDRILGNVKSPFVINLDNATSVSGVATGKQIARIEVYDVNGRAVLIDNHPSNITTNERLSSTPNGIYIQKVIYDDGTVLTVNIVK